MNSVNHRYTRVPLCAALLLALSTFGGSSTRAFEREAGMAVYRDPTTGQFVEPPLAGPDRGTAAVENSRLPELTQRTNPVGGGVTVDLKGHFRNTLSVSRAADGHTSFDCVENGIVRQGPAR